MRNKIWEQVGQFLNRLRCENVTRDTAIEVPGYRKTQEEMEELREKCEAVIQQLPPRNRESYFWNGWTNWKIWIHWKDRRHIAKDMWTASSC